eukprot:gnl/TRDRNA2_/TRDRNA2_138055_c0_seq1.p1 gnl/TRDRNA2_/TRDRNA2_138055_c0~~gnl/TRDRNA2_/TRDRNA2_138055_c0_seq1.p1  ORF type:complete len:430 (-),score=73.88 gnl/TRDRNA2_/TRDRNA2_138055_c0_seq1:237-1346(-)
MTQEERKIVAAVDPGVEGSKRMIGSAVTQFEARLAAEGGKPLNAKTLKPEEWSKMHGIKLKGDVYTLGGTKVIDTDHGVQPALQYVYTAGYTLEERPRRIALLVMDIMIDYIPFVGYLIPEAKKVLEAFKARGLPVFWSNYLRRSNDGLYGALDRFYGPRGVDSFMNPMYVYAKDGGETVPELAPNKTEVNIGRVLKSTHLNKFADVDAHGKSIFAKKLQSMGVDTLVIVGSWTEDCVYSTAAEAVDKLNIDVVLVREAVGTATPDHFPGLELMESGWTKIVSTKEMVDYLQSESFDKLWAPGIKIIEDFDSQTLSFLSPNADTVPAVALSISGLAVALSSACMLGALSALGGASCIMRMRSYQPVLLQ